jgi:transglutaminase-like putative cysteine protease
MTTQAPPGPAWPQMGPSAPQRPAPPARVRRSDEGRRHDLRRTLLAALACALGVLPLCELFVDRGWLIDVWLTMAIVVAPAALLRRTRPASAVQIWIGVVLLIPWLTVTFVHQHAVLGFIPLHGAWHDVGNLLHDLHATTEHESAPIHSTVAVRLALCALIGLVTALVDLLAVVGRRGALAGVPLLIVFTVSGAVPRHPVSWIWFALAAVGFLILLALDSSDDLQRWGHFIPRSTKTGPRRAATLFTGQRIAVIAIAVAVLLPMFIPADSRNFIADLFHDRSNGADTIGFGRDQGSGVGGISPFAALKGQLDRDQNIPLLDVHITPGPGERLKDLHVFYLRTNVLSDFVGSGWRPDPNGPAQSLAGSGFPSSPGTAFPNRTEAYSADITITGLNSNPPIFASPTQISGVDGNTRWDPRDMLLVGSGVADGQQIHESVAQPDPTIDDLRAADQSDSAMAPWLHLPTIAPYVTNLTKKIIARADATTQYAKARAILDYFRGPDFAYDVNTAVGDSGDVLTDFLQHKVGFCQQYAAAMAVMLRLAGVPSRVVLGYAHKAPDKNGSFTVGTFDAHAWVEAYFAGIGWVPFDPTPASGISGGTSTDPVWAPHKVANPGKGGRGPKVKPSKSLPFAAAKHDPTQAPAGSANGPTNSDSGVSIAVPITIGAIVVLIALVLLIPGAVRWLRRRRRLRAAREGHTEAVWAELSDTATDLGFVWSTARTPRQVSRWLLGAVDESAASLLALTNAVERARYAPDPSRTGADLVAELSTVQRGLMARRSTRQRVLARLWPASLAWSGVPVLGRWLPGGAEPGSRSRGH